MHRDGEHWAFLSKADAELPKHIATRHITHSDLVIESLGACMHGQNIQLHKISAQDSIFRRPKAAPLRYPSNHDAPNIGANAGSHPAQLPIHIHMRLATHHHHHHQLLGGRDPKARRQRHGGTCMSLKSLAPFSVSHPPPSSSAYFLFYVTFVSALVFVRSLAYTCARATPTTLV